MIAAKSGEEVRGQAAQAVPVEVEDDALLLVEHTQTVELLPALANAQAKAVEVAPDFTLIGVLEVGLLVNRPYVKASYLGPALFAAKGLKKVLREGAGLFAAFKSGEGNRRTAIGAGGEEKECEEKTGESNRLHDGGGA